MAETETQQNEIIDLDFDMKDVDLSRPVLKDGTYDSTIAFTRTQKTKNGHPQMLIGHRLAEVAENTKGEQVKPGFTLIQRVLMQPTGDLTKKMIDERLGAIHFAATGSKEGKPNTGQWLGKTVRIRVKLREPSVNKVTGEEYPESNEVSGVYPKK